MLRVLCLHDVVADQARSPWEVPVSELEKWVERLRSDGFRFCSLDDFTVASMRDRSVAVTFDDAPGGALRWILERGTRFGIQATIFPVVNWLDAPPARSPAHDYRSLATWGDLEQVARHGHLIGSHGMSHVPMTSLGGSQLEFELVESKRRLEAALGLPVKHFAAPFGKLSPAVVDCALASGYCSVSSTMAGGNTVEDISSGVLKRFVVRSDQPGLGIADRWDAL